MAGLAYHVVDEYDALKPKMNQDRQGREVGVEDVHIRNEKY
jgi:hypothetical protein